MLRCAINELFCIADWCINNSATNSWNSLSSLADLVEPRARSRTEFIDECRGGTLENVLIIYRTFESVDMTGRMDKELVTALPTSVKFVCHNGASSYLLAGLASGVRG